MTMIKTTLDPLQSYKTYSAGQLIEACGLIPMFVEFADEEGASSAEAFMDAMDRAYGFGFGGNMLDHGGTVDEKGAYNCPEDPTLSPYVSLFCVETAVRVFIYPYGLVAVRDSEGNEVMRRFD
jgi:hypothetical protein